MNPHLAADEIDPSVRPQVIECLQAGNTSHGLSLDERYLTFKDICADMKNRVAAVPDADEVLASERDLKSAQDEAADLKAQAEIGQSAADRAGREVERLGGIAVRSRRNREMFPKLGQDKWLRYGGLVRDVLRDDIVKKGFEEEAGSRRITDAALQPLDDK